MTFAPVFAYLMVKPAFCLDMSGTMSAFADACAVLVVMLPVTPGQDGIGKEIWSDGSGFEGSFRPCSWNSSCETYSMNAG